MNVNQYSLVICLRRVSSLINPTFILCSLQPHVAGVLEVNFIEPAHDKQDFERTPVFTKLEGRLKEITKEYWYVSV